MEITDKERRRIFKAHSAEFYRVVAERERILELIDYKAEAKYVANGKFPPPRAPLPEYPEYPAECRGMICGGKGRRSGEPCKQTALYANGRCKWHGGLSTGPKTKKGKAKSLKNLTRGSKS